MDSGLLWLLGALAVGGFLIGLIFLDDLRRAWKRRRFVYRGLTDEQLAFLHTYNLYQRMPADLRADLEDKTAVFLAEKRFEGCDGLVMTDEIRVLIAAAACTLLINKRSDCFPKLDTVLVYPSAYVSNVPHCHDNGVVEQDAHVNAGESWTHGPLVLSWSDTHHECTMLSPAHNVVIHEFAHQLDQLDGIADGIPVLSPPQTRIWHKLFGDELANLRRTLHFHADAAIDSYGATDPAEFFAVTTESFFCTPSLLKDKHPQLYDELSMYFRLDPADWHNEVHPLQHWHGDHHDPMLFGG